MSRDIRAIPLILFLLVLCLALPEVSLAKRASLADDQGNVIPLELFGKDLEALIDSLGEPDRTIYDATYRNVSFFKYGLIASVNREYDEVDKVALTTFESGERFKGKFEGVGIGDHYLSCQARWGLPISKTEQPDQWFDLYEWKVEGHPVTVQIWNRSAEDPNFGAIKELTVKRIEIRRKRERW